jgi:hypothetical protein
LKPDVKPEPELPPQLNHPKALGNTWPVVNPANNPIRPLGIMTVHLEVPRRVLELDSDLPAVSVGNAVRIPRLHALDPQAISPTGEP